MQVFIRGKNYKLKIISWPVIEILYINVDKATQAPDKIIIKKISINLIMKLKLIKKINRRNNSIFTISMEIKFLRKWFVFNKILKKIKKKENITTLVYIRFFIYLCACI